MGLKSKYKNVTFSAVIAKELYEKINDYTEKMSEDLGIALSRSQIVQVLLLEGLRNRGINITLKKNSGELK